MTSKCGVCFLVTAITVHAQGRGGKQAFAQPQGAREVAVAGISGVIAAGAKWTLAWQGSNNADGLAGTADGGLLFAQEQPNQIGKLDGNDRATVFLENTGGAGAVAIDAQGRILAVQRTCTDPGRRPAGCTEPTAVAVLAPERKILANGVDGKGLGRLNDLVADKKKVASISTAMELITWIPPAKSAASARACGPMASCLAGMKRSCT